MNAVTAALINPVSSTTRRTDFGHAVAGIGNFVYPGTRCECLALLHQTIRGLHRAEHRVPSFQKPACRSTNSSYPRVWTGLPHLMSICTRDCTTSTALQPWCTLAAKSWCALAANYWCSIACKMTPDQHARRISRHPTPSYTLADTPGHPPCTSVAQPRQRGDLNVNPRASLVFSSLALKVCKFRLSNQHNSGVKISSQ